MSRLSDVARLLDRQGELTHARAAVLQQAAAPDRPERYKCTHPELSGAGWSHPWPDEEMYPHACCREHEHCPAEWAR
ncbi:hypothetical protein GUY44_27905 [Pimelobacter simplex]|uniref:Uncharacterized protein n=1 Tax=Nocardioides simplex TaxID=2045 RepID=A0A0A1DJ06_NOCSI|nr:hypothetical protein [Pimelobacter simplex]AIY16508.1 hypothetical protein KR76_06505 [Pimelobacter simplex]KAB2809610.1 hypothetical protein F9L07_21655 [Pimelobacter simplex]MCG8154327.1 hypothetical protein [Pimelobacter simplex]SFN01380.1 hypothetical protein SAMN05421671_4627 [Pimelobacter simplex]GEB11766.1 hypothetical protein NSI01_00810 [Pimelobacter simplex]